MDTEQALLDLVKNSRAQLVRRFQRFDRDEDTLLKQRNRIYKHTKDLYDEMMVEWDRKETEKMNGITNLVKEIIQLSADLSVEPDVDEYQCNGSEKTLVEQEADLISKAEVLRAEKQVRMAKFNCLSEQEKILCEQLSEPRAVIEFKGIPHDDQVAELESAVRNLNQLKSRRTKEMEELQSTISTLLTELERIPGNALEREAVGSNPPQLSSRTLENFHHLRESLQNQVDANEEEAKNLWNKIRDLWRRLKTDEDYCTATENSLVGSRPRTIQGLKKELERCEEEKRQNMQSFILELRVELLSLWNKCYASSQDKSSFCEIESTDFTEDLLTTHEFEVAKWKTYFEKNERLIETFGQRGSVWAKWLELEAIEDDPARLSNRGGALLKHDKEKKTTKKLLDKAESDIRKLDAQFFKETGSHFCIRGIPVCSYIDEEKAIAAEERQDRKNMRKRLVEESKSMTPGSRKRPAGPNTPVSTKRRLMGKPPVPSAATTFTKTPVAQKQLKGKPPGTPTDRSRYNFRGADDGGLISPASTYSEFTNHLKSTGLSSSIIQPLASQNGQRGAGGRMGGQAPAKMTTHLPSADFTNQF